MVLEVTLQVSFDNLFSEALILEEAPENPFFTGLIRADMRREAGDTKTCLGMIQPCETRPLPFSSER